MRKLALGDVADWGSGGTPKRDVAEYFGVGVPWLSIADLNDGLVGDAKESLTPLGIASSSAKVVPPGTVLIAMYGSIGKLGITEREMCSSQAMAFAIPKTKVVDTRYLFHFLLEQRPKLQALGRGGTQMNIGQGDLRAWPILLPDLREQRRIAAILDQADALRTERRKVLAHLEDLPQSIFHDMFGGVGTGLWPVEPLQSRLEFLTSGSRGWAKYYADSGEKFLRIQNVKRDELALDDLAYVRAPSTAEARRTLVQPGDVLLSITADLGRTAVIPADIGTAYINQHLCILRAPSIQPRYLSAFISSPAGQYQVTAKNRAAVKAGLNFDDVRSLQVPLPPRDLQDEFARKVEAVNAQIATELAAQELDVSLFSSLQSRAFRGEL